MTVNNTANRIDRRMLLSTLWIFVLLNVIFRDLHEFATASAVEEILTGTINGNLITEQLLLLGAFLVEIPIVMVLLSRVLHVRANRWANILSAIVTIAVVLSALPGDLDDRFFAGVEIVALLAIIWLAWKWPAEKA